MLTLLGFIQAYGYAFVFFFTLLEGEVVVALAGFLASEGFLSLPLVIITAIVGAVVGDHAYFFFGRYKGQQFLAKHPRLAQRADRVHLLIEQYQRLFIFGSRFMYGFRAVLPIAIGTSCVKWPRFLLYNLLGAITWGTFFAGGGYIFGSAIQQFIVNTRKAEKYVIAGVLIGVVLMQIILFIRRRIIARVEAAERKLEEREHTVE